MTIHEYAAKYKISVKKVRIMLTKLKDTTQCTYCKKWNISEKSVPIYIPDKRKYTEISKKYCYIMDAIAYNMLLDEELSCITEEECIEYFNELKKSQYIKLKSGCKEDSISPTDYIISLDGVSWINMQTQNKSKLIIEWLKTIRSICDMIGDVSNYKCNV